MTKRLLWAFPLALVSAFVLALAAHTQVQPTSRVIPFQGTIADQPDGAVDLRWLC